MADEAQIEAIRRLLQLAERHQLAELQVEEDGLKITIRSGPSTPALNGTPVVVGTPVAWPPGAAVPGWTVGAGPAPAMLPEEAPSAAPADEPASPNAHTLVSPMTGTFYRAPDPASPAYCELGDSIEEGQPVGTIEAMKVFSEIPADCSGKVVAFRAENGQLVQQGDPLVVLERSPTSET